MSGYWPEVAVQATQDSVAAIERWLFAAGAISVTYKDQADQPILEPEPGEVCLWDAIILVGLFAQNQATDDLHSALLLAAAVQDLDPPAYQVHQLTDTPWERSWMSNFAPMQFGPRLWIVPSHFAPVDSQATNILLDPGLAFGTGTHDTTALCLQWLGRTTDATAEPFSGQQVVDYGCGSGVLAIAAAKLGAQLVWAVDIDEQALVATRQNADSNGVLDSIIVGKPDILPDLLRCDVLLANILCKPLIALADDFAKFVRPGGCLVLSGILEEQIEALRLRYNMDFELEPPLVQQGWVLMRATRRPEFSNGISPFSNPD